MKFFYLKQRSLQKPVEEFLYRITDHIYVLDTEIKELEYLKTTTLDNVTSSQVPEKLTFNKNSYNKKTLIGDKTYPLKVKSDNNSNYQLQINSDSYIITKQVDLDGRLTSISRPHHHYQCHTSKKPLS